MSTILQLKYTFYIPQAHASWYHNKVQQFFGQETKLVYSLKDKVHTKEGDKNMTVSGEDKMTWQKGW